MLGGEGMTPKEKALNYLDGQYPTNDINLEYEDIINAIDIALKEQAKDIFSKIKNRITNGKSYADIEKEYLEARE